MRLLVVTFAGTLAANVVTVMVVGVALILVKNSKGLSPAAVDEINNLQWISAGY